MVRPFQPSPALSVPSLNLLNYATPFLLCDLQKIEENFSSLQSYLDGFTIFYAIKANSATRILQKLLELGCRFDVASVNELKILLKLGATPDRVIYSNPVKPWQHIKEAFALGLDRFAFDSVGELEKLAQYAPQSAVYVRFNTNDHGSTFPLSKKFGVEPQEIVPLMSLARDLGLRPYGLTFHVGSQSLDPQAWESSIKVAGDVMRELQAKGILLEMLDIGGGFPADYGTGTPPLRHIGQAILSSAKKYLPYKVALVAEPGRAMVADAGVMVTSVIGRTVRSGKNWLYLDVGAFNGMMETLESGNRFAYPITSSRDTGRSTPTSLFTITGPTCDSQDTMFYDIALPEGVMVKDKIYIYSAGAYTTAYASDFFNGFGRPETYYLNEGLECKTKWSVHSVSAC